jgi:hypothetical protein
LKSSITKKNKAKEWNEMGNSKDLPSITGVLQEHDHSDGSVEFQASWLSLEFR